MSAINYLINTIMHILCPPPKKKEEEKETITKILKNDLEQIKIKL
jgi:hypothetical protein